MIASKVLPKLTVPARRPPVQRPIGDSRRAICERLEATKKFGLVSDYFVSWSSSRGRLDARVHVWGNDGASHEIVQNYIAQLLKGFVPAQQITVAGDEAA